jgi:hypothetical protein
MHVAALGCCQGYRSAHKPNDPHEIWSVSRTRRYIAHSGCITFTLLEPKIGIDAGTSFPPIAPRMWQHVLRGRRNSKMIAGWRYCLS